MIQTQTPGRQWLVSSGSVDGLQHVVKRVGGHLSCSCDGSFYRGKCRHQALVMDYLSAADAERAARAQAIRDLVAANNPLMSKVSA